LQPAIPEARNIPANRQILGSFAPSAKANPVMDAR
jgi:hypothetical protein